MPNGATSSPPGNRLRELREAAKESRVELAMALGLKSEGQILRWETTSQDIPIWHARKLAHRYGVTLSYLLKDANGEAA